MIVCNKKYLIERCNQRGYSLEEVMPCVIHRDGDIWTIDVDNPYYPRFAKSSTKILFPHNNEKIENGVGTELKRLLGRIGIKASANCSCNSRAKTMDINGIVWCQDNIETIIDWLQEEASKRNLPFLRAVGKILVNKAIKNATKKQK